MKINIKHGFLYLKISFLSPSFLIEVSKINEFSIFIDKNPDTILIGFKLVDITKYIDCDGISKNNFLDLVGFIENNIDVTQKIYLCENDITNKFAKMEQVYELTTPIKYPVVNRYSDYILF